MKKTVLISFVLIFYSSIVFAQSNLNSYKYILVPKQFEFQKSVDQYQLNSLTKFLFNKAKYTVLYTDDQYPEDLAKNSCLALKASVKNNSSLFKTKITINLYDCRNKLVYTTKDGISKEKEYKKSYQEAIRNAFVDIEELNYAYDSTLNQPGKMEVESKEQLIAITEVETPIVKSIEVKEVVTESIKNEMTPVAEAKAIVLNEVKDVKKASLKILEKSTTKPIEGKFNFENWGISTISMKDNVYVVVGGDENFEFATIYKTSKPTIFIIKWVAFKQPQLLEINKDGDLKIDTEAGVKTYSSVK